MTKDWPPTAEFRRVFPHLFKDFMAAIPLRGYTHADGPLNLASNFPENSIKPDLGEFGLQLIIACPK